MKIKKFKVDVYDWDVVLIEIDDDIKDQTVVRKELVNLEIPTDSESFISIMENLSDHVIDGGLCLSSVDLRRSLILIYKTSSEKERLNLLGHEKRHCEDKILDHCRIDNIEASAYLAGYLTEKLFI